MSGAQDGEAAPAKGGRRAAVDAAPQVADPVPEVMEAEQAEPWLVAVHRDGVTLRVHPTCVAAHRAAGWVTE